MYILFFFPFVVSFKLVQIQIPFVVSFKLVTTIKTAKLLLQGTYFSLLSTFLRTDKSGVKCKINHIFANAINFAKKHPHKVLRREN